MKPEKAARKNVSTDETKYVKAHQKKLKHLTNNQSIPFGPDEVVTNLTSYKCNEDELEILRHGLEYAIPPEVLNKTDIYLSFEIIHRIMTNDLKHNE